MATYADSFQRYEKKYLITTSQRDQILTMAGDRLVPDEHGVTRVYSLYLDTPVHSLINRSLESPLYKEKLRIRSYGEAEADGPVFCEIKKKFDGVVYKRRLCCSLLAARAWLGIGEGLQQGDGRGVLALGGDGAGPHGGDPSRGELGYEEAVRAFPLADEELQERALSPKSLQISHEIDCMRARYQELSPEMLIVSTRTCHLSHPGDPSPLQDTGLRITFDEDIVYRDKRMGGLELRDGGWGHRVIGPGECVMEVKCAGAYPLWLADALDLVQAYPQGFSKYGRAFQASESASRNRTALLNAQGGTATFAPDSERRAHCA